MKSSEKFRKLLDKNRSVTLPGVYDCMSAKIAEKAGFKSLFTSGFGISASFYGKPDYGLISSTEMFYAIKNIVGSVSVPLIVDLDTGYGGPLNVIDCVEEACRLGVAGFILEDQKWPKRCGHMDGKQVIDSDEFVEKLTAARSAGNNENPVIIARTDSLAVFGIKEALRRGHEYLDAGADILFIEAPKSKKELTEISNEFKEFLLFANMVEGGKTPIVSHETLESLGFNVIVYPLTGLFSSCNALTISYNYLKTHNTSEGFDEMINFDDFEEIIGLNEYKELEKKCIKK